MIYKPQCDRCGEENKYHIKLEDCVKHLKLRVQELEKLLQEKENRINVC